MGSSSQLRKLENHGYNSSGDKPPKVPTPIPGGGHPAPAAGGHPAPAAGGGGAPAAGGVGAP